MFGFYKNEKSNENIGSSAAQDAVGTVGAVETVETVETGEIMKTMKTAETVEHVTHAAENTNAEAATNSEDFGFLGRFATDKDCQRQVIKHYVCFPKTRDYLNQVKNCRQRIEILEKRKSYRSSVNMDIVGIEIECNEEAQKLAKLRAEVSDEISKINDVRQEMVLIKRYVDGLSWEQIACDMGSTIRAVQSIHGRGLPAMEQVLVADGKIEKLELSDSDSDGAYEHRGYHEHRGYRGYHGNSGRPGGHRYQKYHKPYYRPETHSDEGYEESADDHDGDYADDRADNRNDDYEDYEFFND